jgi:hypothetical protein
MSPIPSSPVGYPCRGYPASLCPTPNRRGAGEHARPPQLLFDRRSRPPLPLLLDVDSKGDQAGVRMLFDWLVVSGFSASSPTAPVTWSGRAVPTTLI